MNTKQIGENIKTFIESRQFRKQWITERVGIQTEEFEEVLEGKGTIEKTEEVVTKLQKVFGIKNEEYFKQNTINYNYQKEKSKREPTPKFDFCIEEEIRSIKHFGEEIEMLVLAGEAEQANEWYKNKQFQDIIKTIQTLSGKIDIWNEWKYNEKINKKG